MELMMTAAQVIFLFLVPVPVIRLSGKVKLFGKVGPIALCYLLGFLLSASGLPYDKQLSQTIASVLVALAIPLVLFGFDITSVKHLARRTVIGFGLLIVSVLCVSSAACVIAMKCGMTEAPALSGMAAGLYVGGTPNLFAVGSALARDADWINLANIADSLIGGIYFLLIVTVLRGVYRKLPGSGAREETDDLSETEIAAEREYDFCSIPKDKKSLLRLAGVIGLAAACLGIGAGLEILINGNMDGSLFIMVTVSVLGIVFSLIKKVRSVKGSYQVGQYLILVFSLGLSMSMDIRQIASGLLPTFAFFSSVQVGSLLLHFILCRLFSIDGGTALITGTAGIYGPPFIAPVANAYGERSLIVPGVICGTLGLIIGNLLGIGLGSLLLALV